MSIYLTKMVSKINHISCAKGFFDKTPEIMMYRQNIVDKINNVYSRHCAEKIETPAFEIKEVFSNKKNPSDNIIELNDQGGSILALRSDLKFPLVRHLSSMKIECHRRISQNGNIYIKDNNSKFTIRERLVSDFDICGPSDPMMAEIQCIRMICDMLNDLNLFQSNYKIKIQISHRRLAEILLKVATGKPESQAIKMVKKLCDNNLDEKIDFDNSLKVLNDDNLALSILKDMCSTYTGPFDKICDKIVTCTTFKEMKEAKQLLLDIEKFQLYCSYYIQPKFRDIMEFTGDLLGYNSYYTGLLFSVTIDNGDKPLNMISGGRYDNLVSRFNSSYKDKMSMTGFTFRIDEFIFYELQSKDLLRIVLGLTEDLDNVGDCIADKVKKLRIKEVYNKNPDFSLTPKGTIDRVGDQIQARDNVFSVIIKCFQKYNAVTIDTPIVERKDLLTGKYGEDSKLIYDLNPIEDEELSLRYDLTVPFARYVVMHPESVSDGKIFKRYQIGRVYRRDNPSISTGRYREFYQCDLDIAGGKPNPSQEDLMKPDHECLAIIYEILSDLDLGQFKIKVNHRKLLDGLFAVCGVPNELFRSICSSVDKLDKTPWHVVKEEMVGKGITEETADRIGKYVELNGGLELVDKLEQDPELMANDNMKLALSEMRVLLGLCQENGNKLDRISFDLSLARGLDYYTGMIFEAVIIERFGKSKEDGDKIEERIGSVSGGGRYDNLVSMFSPDPSTNQIPCVGVSLGVERLMATYQRKKEYLSKLKQNDSSTNPNSNSPTDTKPRRSVEMKKDCLMVISASEVKNPLENPEGERMKIMSRLLDSGINVQHSMKRNPKTLNAFQECEEQGIPFQIVLGGGELARGVVQLRNTQSRESKEVPIDNIVQIVKDEFQKL